MKVAKELTKITDSSLLSFSSLSIFLNSRCEKLKLIRFVKYNNSFELANTGNYFYPKYEELIFKQPNFVFNEDNNNLFMQLRYFHRTFNDLIYVLMVIIKYP